MSLTFVKLDINFFQNPKIQRISRMPGGDTYIKIYVGLLTMAMKSPAPGMIMISDTMAADVADIASHCLAKEDEVKAALSVFKRLNMAEITDNVVLIPSFEEHQNLAKINSAKEKARLRVANYREKHRLQIGVTRTKRERNANVTKCNAGDLDLDLSDKDIEQKDVATQPEQQKHKKQRTLAKHLQLLKDTYRAANNNDPFISEGHAIAISKHWASMGEEKYTMAAKQWAITKKDDGMPHPVGYFAHDPDQYYQKAKATRPVPKVDLDRLMLNVQSAIEAFKREVAMGDIAHAQRSWDYINKYPELRDKYNFKDVRP